MTTLNLKHTTLTEVFEGCYKDEDGNTICEDDFGGYRLMVSGNPEMASTLKKAIETMNSDRYWR